MMDPNMTSDSLESSGPLDLDQLQINFNGSSSDQQSLEQLDINVNVNRQISSADIDNELNGGVSIECCDNNNIVDDMRRGVPFQSLESPSSESETLNANNINIVLEDTLSYDDEPEEVRMVIDELVEESIAAGLAIFVDEQNRENNQDNYNPVMNQDNNDEKTPTKDEGSPKQGNVKYLDPIPPVIISPSSDVSEDKSDLSLEFDIEDVSKDSDAEFGIEDEDSVQPANPTVDSSILSGSSQTTASSDHEIIETDDIQVSCEANTSDIDKSQQKSIEEAQAVWDGVQTVEAGFVDESQKSGKRRDDTPLLTYTAALTHLQGLDYSEVKGSIKTHIVRSGFGALAHFIFGPPKLHRDLLQEREFVFCIAASPLNNNDQCHMRILQTIYRVLTGSCFDCPRYGSHWEEIGFQGNDPATDVRGTGMFGLVQLVYFLKDPKKSKLARDIYKLSLDANQNFPFCIMGLNMSRFTLQALREDLLNKDCNKQGCVMDVVNDFYTGVFLHLYKLWKPGKTMSDSGPVLRDVEIFSKKHAKDVLKNLHDYLSVQTSDVDSVLGAGEPFLNVCSVEKEEE